MRTRVVRLLKGSIGSSRRLPAYVAGLVLNTLCILVPKKKGLVIFGARNGKVYMDNSRYLYEWVVGNTSCSSVHPYWITNSREVFDDLRSRGLPVVRSLSAHGLLVLLRAEYGVYSNRLTDLAADRYLVPRSLKLVLLGHGLAIKAYRFTLNTFDIGSEFAKDILQASRSVEYAISSSAFVADMDSRSQRIDIRKYCITGLPRNDVFFQPRESMIQQWRELIPDWQDFAMTILYAPTWRNKGCTRTAFFPFEDFEREPLWDFLSEKRLLLLLRPHPLELTASAQELRKMLSDNVRLAANDLFPDVNEILYFCDALITDYSSIMHDFLLLDRPLIFVPYDFDEFSRKEGLLYDYRRLLPGPEVCSLRELFFAIGMLSGSSDQWRWQRERLRNMVHKYVDGNASARVAELILKMNLH